MIFFFGSPGFVLVAVLVLVLLATARAALPLGIVGILAFAFLPLTMLVAAAALCALLLSVVLMLPVLVGRQRRPYSEYLAQATLLVIGLIFAALASLPISGLLVAHYDFWGFLVLLAIAAIFGGLALCFIGGAIGLIVRNGWPEQGPSTNAPRAPGAGGASGQTRRLHGTSDYDPYASA